MDNTLITVEDKKEALLKSQLKQTIAKKRKTLATLTARIEMLTTDLEQVKLEYHRRIGNLYKRDDQLDFEIIRFRTILQWMKKGLSFEQAQQKITQSKSTEDAFTHKEEIPPDGEQVFYTDGIKNPDMEEEIRKLWKKMIVTFHPDLTTNPDEKKRREEIMKQINSAYTARDIDALRILQTAKITTHVRNASITSLELVLEHIENALVSTATKLREIKESEWYYWKTQLDKARKRREDLFLRLEKKLLDDIVRKLKILTDLKQQCQ